MQTTRHYIPLRHGRASQVHVMAMTVRSQSFALYGKVIMGGQSYLTAGVVAGLRVIQLHSDQLNASVPCLDDGLLINSESNRQGKCPYSYHILQVPLLVSHL